jgi:hypothetical protein
MLVFRVKLFDGFLKGTGSVFTQTADSELLGSVERVTLGLVWNSVTVSSGDATITLQFENSPDGTRWINQNVTPELNAELVSLGNSVQYTTNLGSTTVATAGFVRVRLAMGGASPSGYLRLWAIGRHPAM